MADSKSSKSTEEQGKETVERQAATQRSSSTLTTDTAALGTSSDSGTPEPAKPLRGAPFGVSGDILNPAFAAPKDEGHERNLREAAERAQKEESRQ